MALACNQSISDMFEKRTPHEAYAMSVKKDSLGQAWIAVSQHALLVAPSIDLPYHLNGYFPEGKPRALAIKFAAQHGERINFSLSKKAGDSIVLYIDLYKVAGDKQEHILAVDTLSSFFSFDAGETTTYILRVQPQLYQSGQYDLAVSVSASLGFPVAGDKASTGSYWGDERDGGKRPHEGIDIFAAKRTPVLAVTDGYITRVAEGGIGGKTIWMRAKDDDIHLYYAHLDEQMAADGQPVRKGDTLGLVGNTGNAKFTPPHLHFGVYTSRGPVDPLPFVNKSLKEARKVTATNLNGQLVMKRNELKDQRLAAGSRLVPLAFTNMGYIVETSDGSIMQVAAKFVNMAN